MWQYNYSDDIYHYGVKGMKWGVRRDKEELDRLAGRAYKVEYNTDVKRGKKKDHKKNTIFTKRNIAIGVAATAAVLGTIGYMRYSTNKNKSRSDVINIVMGKKINLSNLSDKDIVIKKGSKIKRISSKKFEDYVDKGRTIYASFDKKDNRIYKEDMYNNIQKWRSSGVIKDGGNNVYQHTMKMNKDVKVASPRKVAEVYKKIFNVDNIEQYKYVKFMENLSDRNDSNNKTFLDELRKMGYNAIIDENDAGYYTKKPLILLNPGSDIASDKSHKIGKLERILNVIMM